MCVPLALAASGALAQSKTLFSDNFESNTIKSQWSWSHLSKQTAFTQFSGRYSNNTIKLTMDAPKGPRGTGGGDGDNGGNGDGGSGGGGGGGGGGVDRIRYTLVFDFLAIDSWDGNDTRNGPDRFEINNGTNVIFSETFGNVWLDQTFRAPDVGRWNMAYNHYVDSIYRKISVTWDQALGQQIKLSFYDRGLQGLSDESWGIDNVNLNYEFVPAPGAAAIAGLGGLMAAGRRRR
ncbi:MAG: hypothetical protein IT435_07665 [Phycisphaerales bacterium]|nr:hypothetical protein [Phycisphaerales bacterium]